ncbi:MAG: hypothetical protein J3K34DRAFT_426309 [Monoraphidium minutum]|nr:MAG: hypothetical protein J3K34DRAFT_426309 [Monoraphidium minutum]
MATPYAGGSSPSNFLVGPCLWVARRRRPFARVARRRVRRRRAAPLCTPHFRTRGNALSGSTHPASLTAQFGLLKYLRSRQVCPKAHGTALLSAPSCASFTPLHTRTRTVPGSARTRGPMVCSAQYPPPLGTALFCSKRCKLQAARPCRAQPRHLQTSPGGGAASPAAALL